MLLNTQSTSDGAPLYQGEDSLQSQLTCECTVCFVLQSNLHPARHPHRQRVRKQLLSVFAARCIYLLIVNQTNTANRDICIHAKRF